MSRPFWLILILALLLTACNAPVAAPQPAAPANDDARVQTAVAATVAAQAPPPVAAATFTLIPPPTATFTPVPATPETCNRAGFVTDVTVPDDTIFLPNTTFVKTWRLQNTGSCTWTSGYQLVFDHGDQMGAPASIQLTGVTVPPGAQVDVTVTLTSPTANGTYQGDFALRSPQNENFGIGLAGTSTFWVRIQVQPILAITLPPFFFVTKVPFIIVTIPSP